ncbi:hypothetical protein CCACVL1_28835 [Corchorus capsularis]|uniref:Uncharacterized protein n=1 Tax=Corchorus capsularis TaxID=210143 RepID=A0A1R3G573_COCAP|nr:hypothetical protein CCACVL1_28835 [Corchorus capsularis]
MSLLQRKPLSDISNSGKPRLPETRKSQAGVRKPLSDISNSGKPRLPETRKRNKNQSKKLPILAEAEGSPESIDFHNHDECIKAKERSLMISTSEFLDFSDASAEPTSPLMTPEYRLIKSPLKIKSKPSPSPSPEPLWDWDDEGIFHLIESPLRLKPELLDIDHFI